MKIGIIGCGAIGHRHAKHAAALGTLSAVCDIAPDRAQAVAEKYGACPYIRMEAMLEEEPDLDIIAVCTPNGLHAEHSIRALRSGFHVICEKPMALRSEDCRRMIMEAEKADRSLFVVKQNRFNPPVIRVKKLLDEGLLGRIFSVQVNCCWNRPAAYYRDSWHGTNAMDGGILFTQFSHFIDLLYWMLGDVSEVTAMTDNFAHQGLIEFEDTCVASLRFKSGVLGGLHCTINAYGRNFEGAMTILAEKGTVRIGGQYLNTLEMNMHGEEGSEDLPAGNPANDYGPYTGSMSNHDQMYRHVTEVLNGKIKNGFSGMEGLKTVEIIEKIYGAAK